MDGLDDFLDTGTKPAEVTTEPEVAAEPETGPVRDEKGRFAPKETGVETPPAEQAAEPVPPTEQKDQLPKEEYKAIREEREKRQAAEARLAALEQQLQSLQTPAEPAAPPPSLWEDEQGWQQHFGAQVAQQAALNAKLDMSEMLARQANPDFEDMKARFLDMANANPAIVQQALSDPHPWAKAYAVAKNAAKMEALGAVDVTELEAKLREQITAELAAQQPAAPAAPALPASLADMQSSSAPAAPAPPAFEQLFGPRR